MACPGNRMRFDLTCEDIVKQTNELMAESKAVYDAVGSVKEEAVSFDNVVKVRYAWWNHSVLHFEVK